MKTLICTSVIILLANFNSVFTNDLKIYAEYEFKTDTNPDKFVIKLYKNVNLYKIVRKLSDSPGETGIVTTYIDIAASKVAAITEKDGKKMGVRSSFNDDNYIQLIIANKILFAGMPEGKSFKKFTKRTSTEIFLGKDCDIYESGVSFLGAVTKYFMWNNLMLKEESAGYKTTAVTLDENPVFSESEFTVPDGVEWVN